MPEDAKSVPLPGDESDPLFSRLEGFFSDPEFTSAVSDFMGSRASALELRPLEEEQSLATFSAFTEYTRLIEEKLEAFVAREGLSVDELMAECRRVKEAGDAAALVSVDFLLAAVEYASFLRLVADFQGTGQWESGDELGGLSEGEFEDTEAYYRVDGVEVGGGDEEEGLWDDGGGGGGAGEEGKVKEQQRAAAAEAAAAGAGEETQMKTGGAAAGGVPGKA